MFTLRPDREESAALACQMLANSLDAGLTPQQLGLPPGAGADSPLAALLAKQRVVLRPAERVALEAGWRSGRGPQSLLLLASARQRRADASRDLGSGLGYPLALSLTTWAVALLLLSVGRPTGSPWVLVLVPGAALAALLLALRAVATASGPAMRVPPVRDLAEEVAELPYLEALLALYAAGEPLLQAHPAALSATASPGLRERLQRADAFLQGNVPIAEALDQASALRPDTRMLLRTAEHSGQLEQALERLVVARGESIRRRSKTLAKRLAGLCYLAAVVTAVHLIFSFYGAQFEALRSLRTGR
ncbi:MAG: hypothetical protein RL148_273 [Planctomycetota bacterium]